MLLSPRATRLLGAAVVVVLVAVVVLTITSEKPASSGLRAGGRLPPFAAPLATSSLQGDANVLLRRSKGVPRACDVRGPRILNSCQLAERGPSVIAFLVTGSKDCVAAVDALNRLRGRFPRVQFAAVGIRGKRAALRRLVRGHGWRLPVAYDHDGAVANAYSIAVCPTITFARRGGRIEHTTLGRTSQAAIARQVEAIAR